MNCYGELGLFLGLLAAFGWGMTLFYTVTFARKKPEYDRYWVRPFNRIVNGRTYRVCGHWRDRRNA